VTRFKRVTPRTQDFFSETSNINGFHIGDGGTRFKQICREIRTLEVDHTGFAEINSNIELLGVQRILHETAKREFNLSIMSSSTSSTPCSSSFKPGGVMSIVQDDLVSRLLSKGKDPLGRWSYCKYSGRNEKIIAVITIYQVCIRPTNRTGNRAYHQQVAQMAMENIGNNSSTAFVGIYYVCSNSGDLLATRSFS
jgi:hypothetical protein